MLQNKNNIHTNEAKSDGLKILRRVSRRLGILQPHLRYVFQPGHFSGTLGLAALYGTMVEKKLSEGYHILSPSGMLLVGGYTLPTSYALSVFFFEDV